MGCASGKPDSHTKKSTLKQQTYNTKPTNPNNSQDNPEIRNEPKLIVQKQHPVSNQPLISNFAASQTKPIKSNLQDIQKNYSLTQHQVQKTVPLSSSQVKNFQNQPVKQLKEQPALQNSTPVKDINISSDKKPAQLSVIPQKTDQFESAKKPHFSNISSLKADEKKQEVKNSGRSGRDSLLNSVPQLRDDFLVSNITKNNQSAQKVQNQSVQKVRNQSSHTMKQVETSHQKTIRKQGLRTEQIKINVMDVRNNGIYQSSPRPDEFTALNEEQFDLNCEFDPNTLVIDMNKVAW